MFKPPAPPPLHPTTTPPIWCPIPYPINHSNNQGNQIPVHRDAFPLTDLRMNYADPRDILTCEQAVLLWDIGIIHTRVIPPWGMLLPLFDHFDRFDWFVHDFLSLTFAFFFAALIPIADFLLFFSVIKQNEKVSTLEFTITKQTRPHRLPPSPFWLVTLLQHFLQLAVIYNPRNLLHTELSLNQQLRLQLIVLLVLTNFNNILQLPYFSLGC